MKKTWKTMKKWERRVAIARDVLKLISKPNINATGNGYYVCEINGPDKPDFGAKIKKTHKCSVCAKGGLMLALMDLTGKAFNREKQNAVRIEKNGDGNYTREIRHDGIVAALRSIFPVEQLHAVEQCYEQWQQYHPSWSLDRTPVPIDHVESFYCDRNRDLRMRGIMGNIIHNRGTFVPEQGPIFTTRMGRKLAAV